MAKAKNKPQTQNEMIKAAASSKDTRLYKAQTLEVSDERIRQTLERVNADLEHIRVSDLLSLNDTQRVYDSCIAYMKACEAAASMPQLTGLARSMGLTRQALWDFRKRNPEHKTTQILAIFQDAMHEVLTDNALQNNVNAVMAIFVSKAVYGLQDKNVLEIAPYDNGNADIIPADRLIAEAENLPD